MAVDPVTQRWIRNVSDERAVEAGCKFDELRGLSAVAWIEKHCKLYEGDRAGEPLSLRGCAQCDHPHEELPDDEDEAKAKLLERSRRHCECVAAGHHIDWQFECVMRLFGWVRWSEKYQESIRRFRRASIWIAKKNKKSPTLAAIGLYLLAGDDEPGQKVFLGAKDGMQAREIAGKHAIEMLAQSEELDAECKVDKGKMQITHLPSRSILRPMSSANARTKESKEGINGSILIDETHVVDRDFIGRISRAGISRKQPLHLEVSTAGDNPDGYGKSQCDHAMAVIAGTDTDQELFAAVYAAPQDLTDADLEADPLKYGRMANPAFGHTVEEEEFLADYNRSKVSLTEFGLFKMYRLNIWQKSSNPWLRQDDWVKCSRKFTLEDLRGRSCWGGLDLSRTQDMSAIVLVFPDEQGFYLWPMFWLPKGEATRKSHLASFLQWAVGNHLSLIEGDTINQDVIRDELVAVLNKYEIRLQELRYDETFAEELTKRLMDDFGIPRTPFKQTNHEYAAPTADFERLIIDGKLYHPNNPVLNWQAGHVHVDRDRRNGNMRPVKPNGPAWKKIDGIVASVMGLDAAQAGQHSSGSIYDKPGNLAL